MSLDRLVSWKLDLFEPAIQPYLLVSYPCVDAELGFAEHLFFVGLAKENFLLVSHVDTG